MAECIIARGGGYGGGNNGGGLPPVISGYCQIVCNVKDSEGSPLIGFDVRCKDGDTWYNYATNETGQVLFVTNSGAANITAYNFSSNSNIKYIDQGTASANVDAPVTTSKFVNLNLSRRTSFTASSDQSSNIMADNYRYVYFRVANKIDVLRVGAGGGGGGTGWGVSNRENFGGGGGGGGARVVQNIEINKSQRYNFSIGAGGRGAYFTSSTNRNSFRSATSGGSTAGFGYSASGGSGASSSSNNTPASGGSPGGGQGLCQDSRGFSNTNAWLNIKNATGAYAGGGGGCGMSGGFYWNDTQEELFEKAAYRGEGMNSGGDGGNGGHQYYENNGDNYRKRGSAGGSGRNGGAGGGGGGCVVERTTQSGGDYYDNGASWYWGQDGGSGSIYLSFS